MSDNTPPQFGAGDGTVLGPIGTSDDYSYALALQPDGGIVAAGASWNAGDGNYDFGLARYNADGSPDLTFGGGSVTTSFGSSMEVSRGVLVQPDGNIVTAGYSWNGHNYDLALARYTTHGALDTTFGVDGKLTTPIGPSSEAVFAAALQSDGRILVAGYSWTGTTFEFAVVRYTTSGALDTTFGGDGKVGTMVGTGANDMASTMLVQPDGKIVVAGSAFDGGNDGWGFAVARYNEDGSLDTTFDDDGTVITQVGASSDFVSGAALLEDGKLLVAGTTYMGNSTWRLAFARYDADGSLDSSFDGDGIAITTIDSDFSVGSLAVQADGKMLWAGTGFDGTSHDFVVARFDTDGTLDTGFGTDGVASQPGGPTGFVSSVIVQPDGRILVGGDGWNGINNDFAIERYNPDGSLDTTFDFVNTLDAAPHYLENGAPIVLDTDVNVYDAELDALNGGAGDYAGASLTIARHGGASAEDIFGFELADAGFTVNGDDLRKGSENFATAASSGGTLTIQFTSSETPATSALVDDVLRRITYANGSDTPPPNVQLDYLFSDGNTGAQGTGPLPGTVTGTVNVAVNAQPEIHLWTHLADGQSVTFNPGEDQLRIDDVTISARDMSVDTPSAIFSFDGKTVTLLTPLQTLATNSVVFHDGSQLIIGDNSAGSVDDDSANKLVGSAGDDRLLGLGGDDHLHGAVGEDILDGGDGNDNLYGGDGADALNGGADFDYARYGLSRAGLVIDMNTPSAGTGDALGDTFHQVEGIFGSPFADAIHGDAGANVLQGRNGDDTIDGGGGNDNLHGGAGADALIGGADFDYANYGSSLAGLTIDMNTPSAGTGDALGDSFQEVEGIVGSAFDDFILGNAEANVLQGRSGNDTIDGDAGNDNLHGGAGDDHLIGLTGHDHLFGGASADMLDGGAGNDNLHGGAGADALNGGTGFDYARYGSSLAGLAIDMNTPSAGTGDALGDSFLQIEGIFGSPFDDLIHGDAGANVLQGRNGNDTIDGGAGNDKLYGGTGNDAFKFKAGEANGDTVADFDGNGALARDELVFIGYGAGAAFMKTGANTGEISYAGGTELITFTNGALIDASDYTFI